MPVISEEMAPRLFQLVAERNMRAQRHHLRTLVEMGLQSLEFYIIPEMIYDLHRIATLYLIHNPGRLREHDVVIRGTDHVPPLYWHVGNLMDGYYKYLREHWEKETPIHLAAYAFWRFLWIHPFEDGNGRTARAIAYLVLCLKYRIWLPGRITVLGQMKKYPKPLKEALDEIDAVHKETGEVFLSRIERLLEQALIRQLKSR